MRLLQSDALLILILSLGLSACGKAGFQVSGNPIGPPGSGSGNLPPTNPAVATKTDIEFVSSSGKRLVGSTGGKADISVGENLKKVEVRTANGYKVFLSVTGHTVSN